MVPMCIYFSRTIFVSIVICLISFSLSLTLYVSRQDIVCPEAVKIDDLDPAAVTANYEAAKSKVNAAAAGSADAAEAMIEVEVNRAMGNALGLSLS